VNQSTFADVMVESQVYCFFDSHCTLCSAPLSETSDVVAGRYITQRYRREPTMYQGWNKFGCCFLLLRPQQRWRSIVMSTSVCVCLSVREHISRITRDLLQTFSCIFLSPLLGPPPAGWHNPEGKGQFWGFSSQLKMHCRGLWVV